MKKNLSAIILILALLAACGGQSTTSPQGAAAPTAAPAGGSAAATTMLRFAVSGMADQYTDLIDAFEAENPGVHVSIVSIEDTIGAGSPFSANWSADAYTRLAATADVIEAVANRTAVEQKAFLDLSQFFASDTTLTPDAFYPGLLESVTFDGKIYSVPTEASYQMINYNKTLFDKAGVDYPQPGWTWADFLATAKALTVGSGDNVTQWGFVQPSFDPVTLVEAKAGLLFDPSVYPPTARLSDAAVVDAVRWYTDLFLTYQVSPYYSTSQQGQGGQGGMFRNEGMRLIESGQAAMWFGASGFQMIRVGRGGQEEQQTTGIVPLPVSNAGDHTTLVTVSGFSISAGTQKADLAWRWIRYLAQQQGRQQGFFRGNLTSTTLPAMPSVAAAAGYWDRLDEDVAAALKYATEHAFVDNYSGTGYDTFNQAVVSVMDDGADIQTALTDAQTVVETEIAEEVAAAPTPVPNLVVAEEEQKALDAGAVIISFGLTEVGRFGSQSLTTLINQFQQAHPDIIVETAEPRGFMDTTLADLAAQYDCFEASPALNDESIASVVNVEPFLAADASTRKEDFFPSVLDQFTYQGQVWGLPGSVTVGVVNYNKDLFDAANVPYPTAGWTTSDFLDKAVALTQGEGANKIYGYVPGSFGINDLVLVLDRLGADMLDQSVDPPRLVFTSSNTVEAFRWYTSLATRYKVEPEEAEDTGQPGGGPPQSQSLIDQGRAAMWIDSGSGMILGGGGGGFAVMIGGREGESTLNTGVVPLPTGFDSANGSGFQTVTGYFISANTTKRQACWTWISYLTQQSTVVSGLPARKSVAQSDEYRQRVGAELADAYLASVGSGTRASFFQRLSDAENWLRFATSWLSDAYSRVVSGETTVDEALDAVQERVDAYRNCVIASEAYNDPEKMMQCLGEVGGTIGRPGRP
ncbi:MAG: extracellular solute-binding protein [Anaerolineae bacterium]|nr:extracellular solute-binding protein [Anaerolineae bacterium]